MAYSGGRDSTALLHAMLKAAVGTGVEVVALHIHHGLSAHADAWAEHCEAQCRKWSRWAGPVELHVERLRLQPQRGESVEALARTARYAALRRLALGAGASAVLLAHHRRDQAETLLLQALRGAGAAGLAGMPARAARDGITWLRPWLAHPREAIEAYVRRHRLGFVEDDSNGDPRFARNRLRLGVWPALTLAFPDAEAVLAASAARVAEASASAADLAVLDLAACADETGIDLAAWRSLAPHRASLVLRLWLSRQRAGPVGAGESEALQAALGTADGSAQWAWGDGELRRYRGRLRWVRTASADPTASAVVTSRGPSPQPARTLDLRRVGCHRAPGWGGSLTVQRVPSGGLPWAWLAALELRERAGTDRFQLAAGRPARSLKKQYQAAGIAAWARAGPVLWAQGQLVFVPGLGVDARAHAAPGERQVGLTWMPD